MRGPDVHQVQPRRWALCTSSILMREKVPRCFALQRCICGAKSFVWLHDGPHTPAAPMWRPAHAAWRACALLRGPERAFLCSNAYATFHSAFAARDHAIPAC